MWFYSFITTCCNQQLYAKCHKKCSLDLNVLHANNCKSNGPKDYVLRGCLYVLIRSSLKNYTSNKKFQEKISVGRKRIFKKLSVLFFSVTVNVNKQKRLQALWKMLQPSKHWGKVVLIK